jgi:hypothetical protein
LYRPPLTMGTVSASCDVRGVIVENQLDRGDDGTGGIKKLEETDELSAAVAVTDKGMDLLVRHCG